MGRRGLRRAISLVAAGAVGLAAATLVLAEDPVSLESLIANYLASRGASVQVAKPGELARRYSLDLNGVIPTLDDLDACQGKTPAEMYDYFAAKGPLPHTGGEQPYIWVNLLKDADTFLFSNSTQFSKVEHIAEFRAQLRRVYAESWSYQEFARWALTSQMFLNRFPSPADRANAAFFLFLGRDSYASEVPVGNMWNGYRLRNPDIPASQAAIDPNYHVYDYDAARCTSGEVLCSAELWTQTGSTPEEAVEIMVSSPLFAEAVVGRYWLRYVGKAMPGNDFPEIRRVLVQGLIEHNFDVNWLIREITTSSAYHMEMMFR